MNWIFDVKFLKVAEGKLQGDTWKRRGLLHIRKRIIQKIGASTEKVCTKHMLLTFQRLLFKLWLVKANYRRL